MVLEAVPVTLEAVEAAQVVVTAVWVLKNVKVYLKEEEQVEI